MKLVSLETVDFALGPQPSVIAAQYALCLNTISAIYIRGCRAMVQTNGEKATAADHGLESWSAAAHADRTTRDD